MNETIKQEILDAIEQYDRIVICRHVRPDGDASGSALGLALSIRTAWPEKDVRVINEDRTDYTAFLGEEDAPAPEEFYRDALCIAVDTATSDRLANPLYLQAPHRIKIDHHIPVEDYAPLSWVEEKRSSCCEMITELIRFSAGKLALDARIAVLLYAGLVTDSGRFQYDSTSGETLRLAALLLEQGIDTDRLFAQLYLEDFDELKYRSYVYENMQMTPNGVAYLFVDKPMQERFGLNNERASNTVDYLAGIKGCLVWLAFIEQPDSIRVRLRSRFTTVADLASRYQGGGHAKAAGATVYSREEMQALINEADALLGQYKAEHHDWL